MTRLFDDTSLAVRNGAAYDSTEDGELPSCLSLELDIDDKEVIRALLDYAEGHDRNQYVLEALKIGVLALRHVGGTVAADHFRQDGDRFLASLEKAFDGHKSTVQTQIESRLKEYFDPKDGRFTDRVERLLSQDGELSQLMKGFIDGENSLFSKTIIAHVGRDSAIMKVLDPQHSDGLITSLRKTVDEQLGQQRDHLLKEFSLDNQSGALTRFITQLTEKHGNLSQDVQKKIDVIIKEFSLNEDNSALSRLVKKVSDAQSTITNEFSLDSETSCLSKLKRELKSQLDDSEKKNQLFQEEVKVSLAKIVTARQEAERSTRHGILFEDAVCEFLVQQSQFVGDVATPCGTTTGLIKGRRFGDCVIELGPDCAAAGAKIVVEAKEVDSYTLAAARKEIEEARKNRDAQFGVFVFSKKCAPAGIETFARYGNDFFVVWDAEDPTTDVFLKASIIAARALCFRTQKQSVAQAVDFEAIDKAVLEIEKRAGNLEDIHKSAETIQSSSKKILERVRIDREALEKQVTILRERLTDLRQLTAE